MGWELKDEQDVSWWHCNRPGYWHEYEVYCSKCQEQLDEADPLGIGG